MPTMPAICVWRPSALTWGERYDKQVKRAARRLAGRCRAAQHMGVGVGVRRRGAAVAMAMTREGGEHCPKRRSPPPHRPTMLEGVRLYGGNGMGVDLHCADALIGVSPYCSSSSEVLLSVVVRVVTCVFAPGLFFYHSIEIYHRKMIAQPGTSEGVYRTDLRGVATWCGRYCPHDDTFAQGTQIMRGRTCQHSPPSR